GGTAPYSFLLTSGNLPPGITLSSDGVISGTPTARGVFTFTIQTTDSSTGTGPFNFSQSFNLNVPDAPTTTIASDVTTSYSTSAQTVNLSATVTSGTVINEGTVTFSVFDSMNNLLGTVMSGTVTAGSTGNVSFPLTAGQSAGSYMIQAVYSDALSNFT